MSSKYGSLLWSLLPGGAAWHYFFDKLDDLIEAIAVDFQAVEDRVLEFIRETRGASAVETIEDWEQSFGIEVDESAPLAQRQLQVAAKERQQGVRIPDYLELVAPLLACTPEDLVYIELTSEGQAARLHPADVYVGHIYRSPALPGVFDLAKAQALLDRKTQAHLKHKIVLSIAARVDDPLTHVDRDLMAGPGTVPSVLAYRREDGTFLRREDGTPLGRG